MLLFKHICSQKWVVATTGFEPATSRVITPDALPLSYVAIGDQASVISHPT